MAVDNRPVISRAEFQRRMRDESDESRRVIAKLAASSSGYLILHAGDDVRIAERLEERGLVQSSLGGLTWRLRWRIDDAANEDNVIPFRRPRRNAAVECAATLKSLHGTVE